MSEQTAVCCAKIFDRYRASACGKKAKVERKGRLYCGTHDPDRLAAIREKSEARWAEEWRKHVQVREADRAGKEIVRLARLAARQEASWDQVADAVAALEAVENGRSAAPLTDARQTASPRPPGA